MAGRRSSLYSRWSSGSSGQNDSSGGVARRLLSFLLRVGVLYALIYVLWLPLQSLFIRLLSVAAERVLALLEHPLMLTALTAQGNSITIHTYITGVPHPLTSLNCQYLHISVVASLALALSVPLQRWSVRAKVCGLALALNFLVMVAVCVVQLEAAAENYASAHLGITIYTVRERAFLDWAIRKSSLAAVFVVPAFLFLTSYLFVFSGAGRADAQASDERNGLGTGPRRSIRMSWRSVSGAVAGCVAACLLLVPPRADSAGRVDLQGLQKIVDLNPSSASALFNLGFNLEKEGRLDEALDSYQRALGLQPDLADAHFGAGNVFFRKGAYDQATSHYEEVLKRQPGNTGARYNLGNTFLNRGLFDLAARSYEEVLRADPEHASAHKNLGETLLHLNRRCDALTHLERSTALDKRLSTDGTLQANISILRSICGPQ